MNAFTISDIKCAINGGAKPRVPNAVVESGYRSCCLTLEWGGMFARYVISLSKFKLE